MGSATVARFHSNPVLGLIFGLQQEKWALEEKLVMLEQSGAAMADELVIKSELVMVFLTFYEDEGI